MKRKEDIVWWSDTGKVIHKNPDCPSFLRARMTALVAMQRCAAGTHSSEDLKRATGVRSWDFNEDIDGGGNIYPPEWMMPCRRCC